MAKTMAKTVAKTSRAARKASTKAQPPTPGERPVRNSVKQLATRPIKTGRRPGPSQTRQQILDAARQQFAERGYTATTIRSVAQAANVHQALVHYHFGSKQQLYRDALDLPVDPWEVLSRLVDTIPREQLAEALTRQVVSAWRDRDTGVRLRALIRQAFSEPDGTRILRAHLETVVIPHLTKSLELPEVNVAAALSHLIGLTIADSMIGVRPFTQMTEDDLVALIAPVISRYLTNARPQ